MGEGLGLILMNFNNEKFLPTSPNTAYTLRASPLAFGTLLPSVATSYMLGTLDEIAVQRYKNE